MPEQLVEGLFVMLYKGKGKVNDRSKYCCICLLNHVYKLLSAALLRRLVLDCDGWLPESQARFMKAISQGGICVAVISCCSCCARARTAAHESGVCTERRVALTKCKVRSAKLCERASQICGVRFVCVFSWDRL